MGLRIQTNVSALNTHRQLQNSSQAFSKSLQRLSSGYRINSAADDAAGLAIANAMRADIASFRVASRNADEATSLLQVAEGAMDQIGNMLNRLKELATQAASANATSNLTKINDEASKLISEIDRIAVATEYADTKLINGTFGVTTCGVDADMATSSGYSGISGMTAGQLYTLTDAGGTGLTVAYSGGTEAVTGITAPSVGTQDVYFGSIGLTVTINQNFDGDMDGIITASGSGASDFQVGAENASNNRISISLGNATQNSIGKIGSGSAAISSIDLSTASGAQTALDTVDNAISDLATLRGDVGAYQNRLSFSNAALATTIENTSAAESVIRDVDMAAEMTTFTKNQILLQAGTAMLAQANMAPQQILSLFG